jgi:hypothetical protein
MPKQIEEVDTTFKDAVDWAAEVSVELHGGRCGICSWSPWNLDDNKDSIEPLKEHIRRKHRDTIIQLHENEVLDLSALKTEVEDSDDLMSVAGLSDVRQLDRTDLLAVPAELRKEAEINGETFFWKRREEVDSIVEQGAVPVRLNGSMGDQQHSTEDGILKAREMVCVKVPFGLAQQRRIQKDDRVTDQLNARAEEIKIKNSDAEQKVYDHIRKERNLDKEQAERMTKAIMGRVDRESALQITDRHSRR